MKKENSIFPLPPPPQHKSHNSQDTRSRASENTPPPPPDSDTPQNLNLKQHCQAVRREQVGTVVAIQVKLSILLELE